MLNPVRGDLRLALFLGALSGIATLCLLPYVLAIMPQIAHALQERHVPVAIFAAGQSIQAAVLCAIAAWAGLRLGHGLALDAPLLRAVACGRALPSRSGLALSALLGAAAGACVLGMAIALAPLAAVPVLHVQTWKLLAASLYGGIAEEVLARLFVMTLAAWALQRLRRTREGAVPSRVYWGAIAVSSLLFAAAHLPTAIAALGAGPMVVARTFVLNAIPGALFGWLYWRRGLEHAMVAHLCADLVLHGIGGS